MTSPLDQPQDRGDFFKSLGKLFGGFVAEQMEEAITQVNPKALRPPGALDEFEFLTKCTRCEKCITACPQDTLIKGGAEKGLGLNAPYFDPRGMPCFLCTDLPCITACEDEALVWPQRALKNGEALEGPRAVKIGTARILTKHCFTYEREEQPAQACRTCVDRCPYPGLAIRIGEEVDGRIPHPEVIEGVCTGCGLCVFGCPTTEPAIVIDPR